VVKRKGKLCGGDSIYVGSQLVEEGRRESHHHPHLTPARMLLIAGKKNRKRHYTDSSSRATVQNQHEPSSHEKKRKENRSISPQHPINPLPIKPIPITVSRKTTPLRYVSRLPVPSPSTCSARESIAKTHPPRCCPQPGSPLQGVWPQCRTPVTFHPVHLFSVPASGPAQQSHGF
jgi:hypothetical protein